MDKVAVLLNEMVEQGIIADYLRSVSMRADIQAILKKQAAWQRSRAKRPWAQKLRDSVAMRRALKSLKKHPSSLSEKRPNQE
ncbi:MAG: hypothetical protein QNJ58_23680 [Desulfobacterales bacterium]|nr:hypothetical protein [Desulfobacterales bacterium]